MHIDIYGDPRRLRSQPRRLGLQAPLHTVAGFHHLRLQASSRPLEVSRKGWLYKLARGGRVTWQRRYFALAGSTLFFADDPDVIQAKTLGYICICTIDVIQAISPTCRPPAPLLPCCPPAHPASPPATLPCHQAEPRLFAECASVRVMQSPGLLKGHEFAFALVQTSAESLAIHQQASHPHPELHPEPHPDPDPDP